MLDQKDSSAVKGTYLWPGSVNPQGPLSGRREPTPVCDPLTSVHALWHVCMQTHTIKKNKCNFKKTYTILQHAGYDTLNLGGMQRSACCTDPLILCPTLRKKKKAFLSVGGCNVDISPLSLHRSLGVTHEQTALLKWPFLKKIP